MKRKESNKSKKVSAKIDEMLQSKKMLRLYKKTIEDQHPYLWRHRKEHRQRTKYPSQIRFEALNFYENYRRPFKQPFGIAAEMYRQAIEADLDE